MGRPTEEILSSTSSTASNFYTVVSPVAGMVTDQRLAPIITIAIGSCPPMRSGHPGSAIADAISQPRREHLPHHCPDVLPAPQIRHPRPLEEERV